MSEVRKVRLWFLRETANARVYSKLPPERHPGPDDEVMLPKSQIEHTTKFGNEHHLTIPEWLADARNL